MNTMGDSIACTQCKEEWRKNALQVLTVFMTPHISLLPTNVGIVGEILSVGVHLQWQGLSLTNPDESERGSLQMEYIV